MCAIAAAKTAFGCGSPPLGHLRSFAFLACSFPLLLVYNQNTALFLIIQCQQIPKHRKHSLCVLVYVTVVGNLKPTIFFSAREAHFHSFGLVILKFLNKIFYFSGNRRELERGIPERNNQTSFHNVLSCTSALLRVSCEDVAHASTMADSGDRRLSKLSISLCLRWRTVPPVQQATMCYAGIMFTALSKSDSRFPATAKV